MDERVWLNQLLAPIASGNTITDNSGHPLGGPEESQGETLDLTKSHPNLTPATPTSGAAPKVEPPLWAQAFDAKLNEGIGDAIETLREAYPSRVATRMEATITLTAWPKSRAAIGALRQERLKGLASSPVVAGWLFLGVPMELDQHGISGLREGIFALSDWRSMIHEELPSAEDDKMFALMRLEGFFNTVVEPMMFALLCGDRLGIHRAAIHYLRHNAVHQEVAIDALESYLATPEMPGIKEHARSRRDAFKALEVLKRNRGGVEPEQDVGQSALDNWDEPEPQPEPAPEPEPEPESEPKPLARLELRTVARFAPRAEPPVAAPPNGHRDGSEGEFAYNLPQRLVRRGAPDEPPPAEADINTSQPTLVLEDNPTVSTNANDPFAEVDPFEGFAEQYQDDRHVFGAEAAVDPAHLQPERLTDEVARPPGARVRKSATGNFTQIDSTRDAPDELADAFLSELANDLLDDIPDDPPQDDGIASGFLDSPPAHDANVPNAGHGDIGAQLQAALGLLARDDAPQVRAAALRALSESGLRHRETSTIALEASRDNSPEVRVAAAELLAKLLAI